MNNLLVRIFSIVFLLNPDCLAVSGREIKLPGDPGSIATADLDGDGFTDMVLIVAKTDLSRSILVFWGEAGGNFSKSAEIPINLKITRPGFVPSMRDTTSRSVAVADFNSDGQIDIGTGAGMALNLRDRKFKWIDFKDELQVQTQPVGIIKLNGKYKLAVRVDGGVNFCDAMVCNAGIRSEHLKDGLSVSSEMIVFDYDGDGKVDILAGSKFLDPSNSFLWLGKDNFKKTPLKLEGLGPIDIQVADLNGDGRIDFISQVREFISDFPSETNVFLNGSEKLSLLQTVYNFDNHNDNAVLIKNATGCFDYLQIGVDRGFGKIESKKNSLGICSFEISGQETRLRFEQVSEVTGIGIQCLPLHAQRKCSVAIRRPLNIQSTGAIWLED